jgi:hypothetical protein
MFTIIVTFIDPKPQTEIEKGVAMGSETIGV